MIILRKLAISRFGNSLYIFWPVRDKEHLITISSLFIEDEFFKVFFSLTFLSIQIYDTLYQQTNSE